MGEDLRKGREKIFTEKQLAQCRTIDKAEEKNATRADGGSKKIMFILERTLTFTLKGGSSLWKCCNSEVLLLLTI